MKISEVELFDIDSISAAERLSGLQLDRNAFVLCTAGSITIAFDDKEFTLHPGDIYIYPAFSKKAVRSSSPNFQGFGGAADFELVLKALEAVSHTQHLARIRTQPHVSLTAEQFGRITRMVDLVRQRRNEASVFAERIALALIQILLFELMDAYVANTPSDAAVQSRADTVFVRFLSVLSQNFRKQREVSFYASEMNLTPRYFATIIREKSGMSPGGWIARFVIAEAKTLLANPDNSVKEVSNRLNFPNQSFFGRYFRQNTGLTPGQYRKSLML
ncbi:MAG: AraC family transcriptional regulator [Muribaculaceae bacterium]|jgi:AraC family transcriptional activator of pobA|nr:AraC family transcriptional regulator [Muribaculaceae bacterium]